MHLRFHKMKAEPLSAGTITLIAMAICLTSGTTFAGGKLYCSHQTGCQVTVLSSSGLDTDHAVIRFKHTRDDAKVWCEQDDEKVTEKCITEELKWDFADSVSANCQTGEFSDFFGYRHRFEGLRENTGGSAPIYPKYALRDLPDGEISDGSGASAYGMFMQLFRELCPKTAPSDE